MKKKWAVLFDVWGEESVPCGLAVEKHDHVSVFTDDPDRGIPTRFEDTYRVLQIDGTEVERKPGDDGYFNQVLLELHIAFAIGHQGEYGEPCEVTA